GVTTRTSSDGSRLGGVAAQMSSDGRCFARRSRTGHCCTDQLRYFVRARTRTCCEDELRRVARRRCCCADELGQTLLRETSSDGALLHGRRAQMLCETSSDAAFLDVAELTRRPSSLEVEGEISGLL
ncbi:hypothetical protein TorRG33x02_218840, partial [Trema orientale]